MPPVRCPLQPTIAESRLSFRRWAHFGRGALLVGLLFCAGIAGAEPERPRVEIGWTEQAPEIDGRLEEGEWAAAGYVERLTQALPDPGVEATERTEIWIMTDEDHFYLAARLWDSESERIVANAMSRDGNTRLDDRFGFTIDPFYDRQNGYFFQVNVNGVRRDFLIEGG